LRRETPSKSRRSRAGPNTKPKQGIGAESLAAHEHEIIIGLIAQTGKRFCIDLLLPRPILREWICCW
jgi:hypothetical protein